jgi:uncharacterized membrane protein YdbT with pleckstrin-like domain
MELLDGETVVWSGHPTWRATLSMIIKGMVAGVVLLVLGILVDTFGGSGKWTVYGIVALLVVGAGAILTSWVTRRFTEFTITNRRLHIRRGILSKTETSTAVERIQNVTVTQSPVDRILKTGTIDFDTASNDPSDTFRFAGIDNPQALRERMARVQDAAAAPAPDGT